MKTQEVDRADLTPAACIKPKLGLPGPYRSCPFLKGPVRTFFAKTFSGHFGLPSTLRLRFLPNWYIVAVWTVKSMMSPHRHRHRYISRFIEKTDTAKPESRK